MALTATYRILLDHYWPDSTEIEFIMFICNFIQKGKVAYILYSLHVQ